MPHPYFDLPGPVILGHRGAAGVAPENTLFAFERGLADGAHIIESDVHITRDGVPVLVHDPSVDRTTDGSGLVAELSLEELHRLDAGHRFRDPHDQSGEGFPHRGQGLRLPTLEEAFTSFPGVRFNLEIKANDFDGVRRVVELVADGGREDLTLLTSGENEIMAALRDELARTGLRPALGAALCDILEVVRAAQAGDRPQTDSMALQIPREFAGGPLVTQSLLEHCHLHGIVLHAWTINDPDEMTELIDMGVDGLVTDVPGVMAKCLAEAGH